MRAQEFLVEAEQSQAQAFIDRIYSEYPEWPYGQADRVMVWGEGDDQQFAAFKLKPALTPNTVEIDWLMAGPEQRKGVGSRAIKELQQQATEAGIKLSLYPWGKGRISQASLSKLYRRHGFKPLAKGAKQMTWEPTLDEGLRDWIAALAATGAIAMGTPATAAKAPQQLPTANQQAVDQVTKIMAHPLAQVLKKTAIGAGIHGVELAQFMAQCAHETANFTALKEIGGSLDFKKYDPKHAPKKARVLGNIQAGDGARYAGRGFIQLTGRDNYRRAGQALGLPLEQRPELVEKPEIAAKVAVWFWQNRVAPRVANFNDTQQATKPINPGMRGLADRHTKFNAIKQGAMTTPQQLAPRGRRI